MNKKRMYIVLFSLILLSLFAATVSAALLDPVLSTLDKINIVGTYGKYGFIIDTILYFVILIGAAQAGLGERFKDQKSIVVAVGIALAIGAAIGEQRTGFRLGNFWPLALLMAILAIAFGVYGYFKKISGTQNRGFAMLGFAFLFFYIQSAIPGLASQFANSTNDYVKLIWSVVTIIAIVCIFWGIWELIGGIAKWGAEGANKNTSDNTNNNTAPGPGGPGLWSKFWNWRDRRNKGKKLDYDNPGKVIVKVVDLNNQPLNGVEVILKGEKWLDRNPKLKSWTQPPDGEVTFNSVPSGLLIVEARHPGYSFFKFYTLRPDVSEKHDYIQKDIRKTTFMLRGGETAEVTIQLRREEHGYLISGRVINHELAISAKVSIDATGAQICTGYKETDNNIGADKQRVVILNMHSGSYKIVAGPSVTNRFGEFTLSGMSSGNYLYAALINERDIPFIDHTMGDYGRGGKRKDNPKPPQNIVLSVLNKHEKNVVIDAVIRGEISEPPPDPRPPEGKAKICGFVVDEDAINALDDGQKEKLKNAIAGIKNDDDLFNAVTMLDDLGIQKTDGFTISLSPNGGTKKQSSRTINRKRPLQGYFEFETNESKDYTVNAEKGSKKGKNKKSKWSLPQGKIRIQAENNYRVIVPVKEASKEDDEKQKLKSYKTKLKDIHDKIASVKDLNYPGEKLIRLLNKIIDEKTKKNSLLSNLNELCEFALTVYNSLPDGSKIIMSDAKAMIESFKPEDYYDLLLKRIKDMGGEGKPLHLLVDTEEEGVHIGLPEDQPTFDEMKRELILDDYMKNLLEVCHSCTTVFSAKEQEYE